MDVIARLDACKELIESYSVAARRVHTLASQPHQRFVLMDVELYRHKVTISARARKPPLLRVVARARVELLQFALSRGSSRLECVLDLDTGVTFFHPQESVEHLPDRYGLFERPLLGRRFRKRRMTVGAVA